MISDFIPKGKENAITRACLCAITGFSDRAVRHMIAEERAKGVPIISCSHSAGYYMAETEEEKQIILRELGSRISKMAKAYRAIRNTLQAEGQLDLQALAIDMVGYSVEYLEESKQ